MGKGEDRECGYSGAAPKRKTSSPYPLDYICFSKYAFHFSDIKCLQHEAVVEGKGTIPGFKWADGS